MENFPKMFRIRNSHVKITTYNFDSDLRNRVYLNFYWQNRDHAKCLTWVYRQSSWTFYVGHEKDSEKNSSTECQYNTTLTWTIALSTNKIIINCSDVEMWSFKFKFNSPTYIYDMPVEGVIPYYVSIAPYDTATKSIYNNKIDGKQFGFARAL